MFPREFFDTYWRPDIRDQVFVAMSFAAEFEGAWRDIFCPAIEQDVVTLQLAAKRGDASAISDSILTDIMDDIAHSRLIFADISRLSNGDRNANVLYEVGLAHAIRQPEEVVLFRCDDAEMSCDVASIRIHRYWPDDPGRSRRAIAAALDGCLRIIDHKKGMQLQKAVESLDDAAFGLLMLLHKKKTFKGFLQRSNEEIVQTFPLRQAIYKLLELGIIRMVPDLPQRTFNYHWTSFGQQVLEAFGFPSDAIASEI